MVYFNSPKNEDAFAYQKASPAITSGSHRRCQSPMYIKLSYGECQVVTADKVLAVLSVTSLAEDVGVQSPV